MSALSSNSGFGGWWDDLFGRTSQGYGTKAEQAKIADALVQIPARARQIAQQRIALMQFRGKPVDQGKVLAGLSKLDEAQRALQALNGMARLGWAAAFKADKVGAQTPPETEVGMSGVISWVAMGIAAAAVVAGFILTAPFLAALGVVLAAMVIANEIVAALAADNAAAMANRQPGDPPVPPLVTSAAASAGAFSLLPILGLAAAAVYFMARRRKQ